VNTKAHHLEGAGEIRRLRLEVRGLVQGVGFRPQVLRIASQLGLGGWVRNHCAGVTIEVEGVQAMRFEAALAAGLPPAARIDSLQVTPVVLRGERRFAIVPSESSGAAAAMPADLAICRDCLRELFDARDRRYLHPFIACCNCGPRYSMTRRLPYDRQHTAMADFGLCEACALEYVDTESRRLHAEPIACHDCGPGLSHTPAQIAGTLRRGGIVALRGVGGYHLMCDARDAAAVRRLRERKGRLRKPLAVMALNSASAGPYVRLDAVARACLEERQAPIVVLARHPRRDLPEALAPGLDTLGVALPYTPLHFLIFHELLDRPDGHSWLDGSPAPLLVCTSANSSGEPMLSDPQAAEGALGNIADLIVHHDRDIPNPCDDTVLSAVGGHPVMLRRSRGYAPASLGLPQAAASVLALGAHLKSTVCAMRGTRAWFSPHIGDLDTPATHALLEQRTRELVEQLSPDVQRIACDLHPDFASTHLAERLARERGVSLVRVQHHHAHVAAVQAAAGHSGPVLGIVLDGHGMGSDGSSWGGEALHVRGASFDRVGHLRSLALPGGDRAARDIWRLAAAWLAERQRDDEARLRFGEHELLDAVLALSRSAACQRSTSAGRAFDLAAALLGVCEEVHFEAQAAMQLEGLCAAPTTAMGLYHFKGDELDLNPLFGVLAACGDARKGAALFHGVLIDALADWAQRACDATGLNTVALGGGCFANRWLASGLPPRLMAAGIEVLTGWDRVPPGDGGIALGQAWVAAQSPDAPGEV